MLTSARMMDNAYLCLFNSVKMRSDYFRLSGLICFLLISFEGFAQQQTSYQRKRISLGNDTVYIDIFQKTGAETHYVHVHENEQTALEAGLAVLQEYGGKLITLQHSKDTLKNRFITFSIGNDSYRFDPNRIYSRDTAVLIKTLVSNRRDKQVSRQAVSEVMKLADTICSEIRHARLILAIHNNKNEPAKLARRSWFQDTILDESFSILSYARKFEFQSSSNKSCAEIYINPEINNSEFFIVTERHDFDNLLRKRYSVVLQNENPVDDGSMSVFAKLNAIRYVNAEAKMGKLEEQLHMLHVFLKD